MTTMRLLLVFLLVPTVTCDKKTKPTVTTTTVTVPADTNVNAVTDPVKVPSENAAVTVEAPVTTTTVTISDPNETNDSAVTSPVKVPSDKITEAVEPTVTTTTTTTVPTVTTTTTTVPTVTTTTITKEPYKYKVKMPVHNPIPEDLAKVIPKYITDFLQNLDDKEKEAIVLYANAFAETGDSDKGRDYVFDNNTELAKKLTNMTGLVTNITDRLTAHEQGSIFVGKALETIGYIQAAELARYQMDPEYLKAVLHQFIAKVEKVDKSIIAKELQIPYNFLTGDNDFKIIRDTWEPVQLPEHSSAYPSEEDYKPFSLTDEVYPHDEEEEDVEDDDDE